MNQSTQKKLTLQVDPKEVAYLIQNQLTNEILHFRSYALDPFKNLELELEKMFSSDELLFTDFDEVEILHKNNLNTLVPNEFFNEAVLGSYLQYNVKVFPTDFFASDELVTIKANNVYVPYVAFNNYFIDKFGSFTYKHIFTPLIEYASSQSSKDEQKIWLYKSDETLVILAFKNNELMFFNSFDMQSKEDLIYYVLFVFEQLQLEPSKETVHLFGQFDIEDEYYTILYQYINKVEVLNHELMAKTFHFDKKEFQKHFTLIHS